MLDDGIHTLAYGHKDITTKVESVREGGELIILTYEEAVKCGYKPFHPVDATMVQPRPRVAGVWEGRRKKRVRDGRNLVGPEMLTGDQTIEESDSSEEDICSPKRANPSADQPAPPTTSFHSFETNAIPDISSSSTLATISISPPTEPITGAHGNIDHDDPIPNLAEQPNDEPDAPNANLAEQDNDEPEDPYSSFSDSDSESDYGLDLL